MPVFHANHVKSSGPVIPACVFSQPSCSEDAVAALPGVQKIVTFVGNFSANLQEGGCCASLSSLKTAYRQL